MCVGKKKTHTESCVYRFGAVTRGCAVYLSFLPLFESITCFFIFSDVIEMKLLGFQMGRKEGRKSAFKDYLQKCSHTSAEQAPASVSVCESTARLTWQRRHGPGPCPNFCPQQDTKWWTSFERFASKWVKKETFSCPPLSLSICPRKTAGIGPFGAVLLLSSILRWSDELGTLWDWEEKRGSREKSGRKHLQKYCD